LQQSRGLPLEKLGLTLDLLLHRLVLTPERLGHLLVDLLDEDHLVLTG
jgi:hypothetical protein